MKNVLYFGSYREAFEYGLSANSLVQTLSSNKDINLFIRPVYISQYRSVDKKYSDYEKLPSSDFDIIIQHCPISYLAKPIKKYYNIAIPTNPQKQEDINKLDVFDLILVDNMSSYEVLTKKYTNKKVKLFGYDDDITKSGSFSIPMYNNTKKFYFAGEYFGNQQIIQKIIVSFNIAFRSNMGCSLLLFLNDHNEYEKDIHSFIKDTKKKLKIKDALDREIIIIGSMNDNIQAAHRTGDVYLNIYDNAISNYHCHIAEKNNNQIINASDTETISVPAIDDPEYTHGKNKISILTDSLIKQMALAYSHPNKYKKYSYKDTQNINSFLNVK
jgi:hypothetical protein